MPAVFELVFMEPHPQSGEIVFDIALGYEIEEGEIKLRTISSSTHEVDDALNKLAKKGRPLGEQKKQALMMLAADESDRTSDGISKAIRTAHETPTRRARNRVTDALLKEVVQVYREAWESGGPPTKTVAEHFGRPHSTAARWVGEARRRGLLSPSDGSRGGEVTDDD